MLRRLPALLAAPLLLTAALPAQVGTDPLPEGVVAAWDGGQLEVEAFERFLGAYAHYQGIGREALTHLLQVRLVEVEAERAGLRAAMAFAAIALGQMDRVGVFTFADELELSLRPQTGWSSLPRFADRLAKVPQGGGTDFEGALRRFGGMPLRRGLAVVISDFFDPRGLEAIVAALKPVRHRLLLVQLTRPGDREPQLDGDLRLRDCETSGVEEVTVTPQVLARYREAYDRFQGGLLSFARRREAGMIQLDAGEEVVPQIAALFENGRWSL